jgi:hypothetical protein
MQTVFSKSYNFYCSNVRKCVDLKTHDAKQQGSLFMSVWMHGSACWSR